MCSPAVNSAVKQRFAKWSQLGPTLPNQWPSNPTICQTIRSIRAASVCLYRSGVWSIIIASVLAVEVVVAAFIVILVDSGGNSGFSESNVPRRLIRILPCCHLVSHSVVLRWSLLMANWFRVFLLKVSQCDMVLHAGSSSIHWLQDVVCGVHWRSHGLCKVTRSKCEWGCTQDICEIVKARGMEKTLMNWYMCTNVWYVRIRGSEIIITYQGCFSYCHWDGLRYVI